jgi:hypothetical protein
MTSTVCRAIAVYSRTWDWPSPKQALPNSASFSAGQNALPPLGQLEARMTSASATTAPSIAVSLMLP